MTLTQLLDYCDNCGSNATERAKDNDTITIKCKACKHVETLVKSN